MPSSPPIAQINTARPCKGFPFVLPISRSPDPADNMEAIPSSFDEEDNQGVQGEDTPEFENSEDSGSIHTDDYPWGEILMPRAEFL
jgi:hypothetical protein